MKKKILKHAFHNLWPSLARLLLLQCQMALTLHYLISKLDILVLDQSVALRQLDEMSLK